MKDLKKVYRAINKELAEDQLLNLEEKWGSKYPVVIEAFTSDKSLFKLVYLATKNIEKKWTAPLHNWSLTIQQFYIKFGNRIPLSIKANLMDARKIDTKPKN